MLRPGIATARLVTAKEKNASLSRSYILGDRICIEDSSGRLVRPSRGFGGSSGYLWLLWLHNLHAMAPTAVARCLSLWDNSRWNDLWIVL